MLILETGSLPDAFSVVGDLGYSVGDEVNGDQLATIGVSETSITQFNSTPSAVAAVNQVAVADAPYAGDPTALLVAEAAAHAPVQYTWKDNAGKTVNLRSNVNTKIVNKHNLTWKVARTTTKYPARKSFQSGTSWRFETPVYRVTCSGVWIFRKCKVAQTVTVRAAVDYRTNTSDGRPYGVVTTYCLGYTLCPSFVKNALNV
ncbi:hypothetical protein GCM10025778_15140 [Paeniglutamicibacter antarcticus]|uniref:Uncharacterized protein n=2 Tax=Paeniglutamicibacter antarcticus TaxID=494023 RepID=A0ABP9TLI8_9MICC